MEPSRLAGASRKGSAFDISALRTVAVLAGAAGDQPHTLEAVDTTEQTGVVAQSGLTPLQASQQEASQLADAQAQAMAAKVHKDRAAAMEEQLQRTERRLQDENSTLQASVLQGTERCKDLQEVCEGQTQFARRSAGGVTAGCTGRVPCRVGGAGDPAKLPRGPPR